jgi:hypothetical protein
MMSAKSGTNPLEVLEWVAYGRFMPFQNNDKFMGFFLGKLVTYDDRSFLVVIKKDIF